MIQSLPPGPAGRWGGLNHLWAIRTDFRAFAHALHQAHGDVVHYRVLGQSIYHVARPDLAHDVLVVKAKALQKATNQKRAFARIMGNNLFTSDGKEWLARRRLLGPVFLPQFIERYRAIVIRQTAQALAQISASEVDLSELSNRIVLLSLAEALFGAEVNDVADQFLEVATQLQGALSRQILSPALMPLWIPTRDNRIVSSALRFFHRHMTSLIEQRRQSPGLHTDMLTALLNVTSADDGQRWSERQAVEEALTMLLAGKEMTAASITWSAFLLAKHAEQQRHILDETTRLTGRGPLLAEHAPDLTVARQVYQEAMRLYPPAVAIARQALEPLDIGGVHVPRGALVFVSAYTIHRDARWFHDPEKFCPERFSPQCEAEIPKHAYLPFGLGTRTCIGRRFAMMEGPLVLAEMVRRFELALIEPSLEPELETQLSMHPRNGLRLGLKRRPIAVT